MSTSLRTFINERGIGMSRKTKRIHRRVWLCPSDADTMSYVAYSLNDYGERGSMNISIADCSRKINFYFDGDAKGKRKLDKLISILEEAREKYNAENTDS